MEQPDINRLAEQTRNCKLAMQRARLAYYGGAGSYEEMMTAATAFCRAFEAYQLAKTGKKRRLDPRAVLR
jgi:hypothetical protein